jgi:uncharacterized protein
VSQPFIGAGWAFPLHTDSSGGFALATGPLEIEQAIRLILGTAPGERPMRPEFGCGIHDLVFDPINEATMGIVRFEVASSLERWEPRIDVTDVVVTSLPEDDTVLLIDVRYSVSTTNNPRNLVFPFYVIPPSESEA